MLGDYWEEIIVFLFLRVFIYQLGDPGAQMPCKIYLHLPPLTQHLVGTRSAWRLRDQLLVSL